jgi:hypothetical protein
MVARQTHRPGRLSAVAPPIVALLVLLLAATLLAGCDIVTTTPYPEFLGYTDLSVDLSGRIEEIWDSPGEVDYQLDVVYTATDPARVLLVVEPPSDSGDGFDYRGRLLMFDADLNLVETLSPLTDLDFFSRPFVYGHDGGVLLVSTMLIEPGGYLYDDSLTFEGLEGPAIADVGVGTYVFSAPPGSFTTFDVSWREYTGTAVVNAGVSDTIYSPVGSGSFPIIPSAQSGDDAGYQILDAYYNEATGEVTFLLSEPAAERVVAARTILADITGGSLTSLASGPNSFPIEVGADRPLDYHVDEDGFFLRRRDGLLERYDWTPTGELRQTRKKTLIGDRYFFRSYAFLSGDSPTGEEYMYRFDPSARILTRYKKWW